MGYSMFAFENVCLKRDNKMILSDINWVVNDKENWQYSD